VVGSAGRLVIDCAGHSKCGAQLQYVWWAPKSYCAEQNKD